MFKKFAFLILLVSLILPFKGFAQNNVEEIRSYSGAITVNTDATIDVVEEIKYFFPTERHGIYRYIPYRYLDQTNNKYFLTPIENLTATDDKGNPYEFTVTDDDVNEKIKIGDKNKTVSGEKIYKISYKVTGVINYFNDHDELYWNATGNNWTVPINDVKFVVNLPTKVDSDKISDKCYTGETASTEQNCKVSFKDNVVTYVAPKGPLTVVTGWNKGVVAEVARTYEKTWRHESGWYWLIFLFSFVFLIFLYFKNGRDPFGRGTIVPEFSPPEKLLPAEIGTLIDEKAGNSEISATIIDLAVRGYLKIIHEKKEYTLVKLKQSDLDLSSFEKKIFEALFSDDKEVKLSKLYESFSSEVSSIKNDLYDDLAKRKYFIKNPKSVRNFYYMIGIIIIVISGGFFILSYNLVFALGFSGILVLIFSRFMPKKTKEGVITKEKCLGFKEFLYRADRYKLKWQEKQNIFEEFLPYAMIFGIAKQWAKNFEGIYKTPPSWYQGDFRTFSAVYFVSELSHFNSTASASYSPPASSGSSGFGGGGSSGGGFGGGGGGSW